MLDLLRPTANLMSLLQFWGDFIIIAGGQSLCRIYLYTNTPNILYKVLQKEGTIVNQSLEDMALQIGLISSQKHDIALVTDSSCDLPMQLIEKYKIHLVPFNVYIGENQYLDKMTISNKRVLHMINKSSKPFKIEVINENTFKNLYLHICSQYNQVLAIHLTDQYSSTFTNSSNAANKLNKKFQKSIHVVNSNNISGGLGLIVLRVAMAIEKGKSIESILSNIEIWRAKTLTFFCVKKMQIPNYQRVAFFFASALGIKSLITMSVEGKIKFIGSSFRHKTNINRILKQIQDLSDSGKIWNYILLYTYSPNEIIDIQKQIEVVFKKSPISIVETSSVVGMNVGAGAFGISILIE